MKKLGKLKLQSAVALGKREMKKVQGGGYTGNSCARGAECECGGMIYCVNFLNECQFDCSKLEEIVRRLG